MGPAGPSIDFSKAPSMGTCDFKESLHSSSAWELRRGLLGGARMLLRGSYCLLHWFEEEALIVT